MRKGPRYEVHTKYGWFSLDEGAYQDYLAGKLWITWPPEKGDEKPKADYVPQNISEQALALRDTANTKGVFEAVALHYGNVSPVTPNLPRMAEISIDELALSVRSSNGLMRAGINTFGKLASGIEQDGGLFKIRNLGAKSEKEIRVVFIEECYRRMLPYEKAEYWQSFLDNRTAQNTEGALRQ